MHTITMPESAWSHCDYRTYFSSKYSYFMKQPDALARMKRSKQRHVAQKHLSVILACKQTYAECRLLPFTLNTIWFDSGTRMSQWLGQLSEEQRHAVRSLRLEYTWSMRKGLLHGTAAQATRAWLLELRGLRRVEISIKDAFLITRTDEATQELVRRMDAATESLKRSMEDERPGLEYVVRAVELAGSA